jgi:hypothetical protein
MIVWIDTETTTLAMRQQDPPPRGGYQKLIEGDK